MSNSDYPFTDPNVAAVFAALSAQTRNRLIELRALIFDVAAETDGVGELQETLKWGQPAYLTPETKSGSTLRLGIPKQGGVAIYAHCQTTIISNFEGLFPGEFDIEGNRAVRFAEDAELPIEQLGFLIRYALTYHLRK